MKKILCPTDFSKAAANAAEFAALLADRTGATLTLLHVVHLPLLGTSETALAAGEVLGEHKRQAQEKLHALARYLTEKHQAPRVQINCLVKEALLVDAVQQLTQSEDFDLVVIGATGGSNTLEEIMIGSHTEGVIEKVKCPVLTVPNKAVPAPFHHIVYASNYEQEDAKALGEVLTLAQLFNAEVEIVHVSEAADPGDSRVARFEQSIRAALPGHNLAIHQVVQADEVAGMKGYLTEKNADLLVILKKRRGFFHHLFNQSFSEQLTYQSKLPMLIYHDKA
jgi:nucleotide-binding universal stress UspA family protein